MQLQVCIISHLLLLEQGLSLLVDFNAHVLYDLSGLVLRQTLELRFHVRMGFRHKRDNFLDVLLSFGNLSKNVTDLEDPLQ